MNDVLTTVQQLLDAATPGPWKYLGKDVIECPTIPRVDQANWGQPTEGLPWYTVAFQGDRGTYRTHDIALMAAAPQMLADLVAEVQRLRAALVQARIDLYDWAQYAGDYFIKKHDLAGDLAAIDAALGETS